MHRLFGRKAFAQALQPVAQRPIVNRVADANPHTAKQISVERKLRFDFLAGDTLERLRYFFFLRIVQRRRGKNFRLGDSLSFPQNILKGFKNFAQLRRALMVDQQE